MATSPADPRNFMTWPKRVRYGVYKHLAAPHLDLKVLVTKENYPEVRRAFGVVIAVRSKELYSDFRLFFLSNAVFRIQYNCFVEHRDPETVQLARRDGHDKELVYHTLASEVPSYDMASAIRRLSIKINARELECEPYTTLGQYEATMTGKASTLCRESWNVSEVAVANGYRRAFRNLGFQKLNRLTVCWRNTWYDEFAGVDHDEEDFDEPSIVEREQDWTIALCEAFRGLSVPREKLKFLGIGLVMKISITEDNDLVLRDG